MKNNKKTTVRYPNRLIELLIHNNDIIVYI